MRTNISIAICTYNRSDQLRVTLSVLQRFKSSLDEGDEVLLIDNNSSDDTKAVVVEFSESLPLRYIFESQQGLAAARNRAIKEFSNDILVFFDDDVSLRENTLDAYKNGFVKYPGSEIFGGRILVEWSKGKPRWYQDDSLPLLNGLLGNYDLGVEDIKYDIDMRLPYGANFALRRAVIDTVGRFDESLGVKGNHIGRGEETDYFERAFAKGASATYIAQAEVGHRFQVSRLTIFYLLRYGKEKGRAAVLMDNMKPDKAYRKILNFTLRGLYQLLKGRTDRAYQCVINIGIQQGLIQYSGN